MGNTKENNKKHGWNLKPPPGCQTGSWAIELPERWWWIKCRSRRGRDLIHHHRSGHQPHILQGFPGPPGPARPQKRTPKKFRPDCLQVPRMYKMTLCSVSRVNFGSFMQHFSSWGRWARSWAQPRPKIGRKLKKTRIISAFRYPVCRQKTSLYAPFTAGAAIQRRALRRPSGKACHHKIEALTPALGPIGGLIGSNRGPIGA